MLCAGKRPRQYNDSNETVISTFLTRISKDQSNIVCGYIVHDYAIARDESIDSDQGSRPDLIFSKVDAHLPGPI